MVMPDRHELLFGEDTDQYSKSENPEIKNAFLAGVLEGRRQSRVYYLRLLGISDEELESLG